MKRPYALYGILALALLIVTASTRGADVVPAYRVEYVCWNSSDDLRLDTVAKTIKVRACVVDPLFTHGFED